MSGQPGESQPGEPDRHAEVPVDRIDLASTLGPLAWLPGDPTVRLLPGQLQRATWTPTGPGAIGVTWRAGGTLAEVKAHGDGADWLVERAPGLLGTEDDVTGFAPTHPALAQLWRRHAGDRIARTRTVWHDLAWFIVQQRVRRQDAADQWRRLVTGLGSPAPGPSGLLLPPDPELIARLDYADLHRFGIERRRADHLVAAARVAGQLQRRADDELDQALPALRSVRGVGPWTASCLASHTWGDPDTVIVGDSGIPSIVAWLLAGERRADDARMRALLEPYRPHRYRVVRLAFLGGSHPTATPPTGPRSERPSPLALGAARHPGDDETSPARRRTPSVSCSSLAPA